RANIRRKDRRRPIRQPRQTLVPRCFSGQTRRGRGRKSETRSSKEASAGGLAALRCGSWGGCRISGLPRLSGLASFGQGDGELGALVDLAGDGSFAAVGFDDSL